MTIFNALQRRRFPAMSLRKYSPTSTEVRYGYAKDVQGVMAMMPSFSTKDAGELAAKNTIDVDNFKAGVDKMIGDGIDVITTTGSFGECYNLSWDEYKTLAAAARRRGEKARAVICRRHQPERARSGRAPEIRPRHRRRWVAARRALLRRAVAGVSWRTSTARSPRCFPSWRF